MLDIFLLGTCRWSELLMYFGSFALWALKFKFFVGRLIANKHLPITDNCQKLKQKRYRKKQDESIHTCFNSAVAVRSHYANLRPV